MHLVTTNLPPHDAIAVAERLLEERLVACCNVMPAMASLYWWQGTIARAQESMLIMKTSPERLPALMSRLAELHPYETPEIAAIQVDAINAPYEAWVRQEARAD